MEEQDAKLTREQRDALLKMLTQQQRVEWWWASLRVWATWISAAIIGAYALYETAFKFLRSPPA